MMLLMLFLLRYDSGASASMSANVQPAIVQTVRCMRVSFMIAVSHREPESLQNLVSLTDSDLCGLSRQLRPNLPHSLANPMPCL